MDRGAWWAVVYGVTQSWTRLKRLSSSNRLTSFNMTISTPIYLAANGIILFFFFFLQLSNIPWYICITSSLSIPLLMDSMHLKNYLFSFGCAGSSLLLELFSSCSLGYSSLRWAGFLSLWLLWLQSIGSRAGGLQWLQHTASVGVVHGLSCPTVHGIFLDQGVNMSPLHWQADSYPLHHLESTTQ